MKEIIEKVRGSFKLSSSLFNFGALILSKSAKSMKVTGLSCNSSVVGINFSFILASYVAIAQLLVACKIWFLWGGFGHISTSIGNSYAERVFFAIFTHFIVTSRILQLSRFKFSDEEKMHAISTPSGIRNFHTRCIVI